jgi:hypothetical protein
VRPIQSNRDFFSPDKKTRAFKRSCALSQEGTIRPIFEGDTPPQKKDPKICLQYWGNNRNPVKNLETSSSGDGRKVRSTAKRQPFASAPAAQGNTRAACTPQTPVSTLSARALYYQKAAFNRMKNEQPGRNHISVPVIVSSSGRDCRYKKCPGFSTSSNRKRSYATKYQCEQCTIEKGFDFWLCHTTKKLGEGEIVVDCHKLYHVEKKLFGTPTGSATECSVISDLTNES